MFTGIIEETGFVKTFSYRRGICRLEILPRNRLNSIKAGDSISISGVCLTLVGTKKELLLFDAMEETFKNTSFLYLKPNDIVNIERALEWKSRVDGHFVLGHVDSVQRIVTIKKDSHPFVDIKVSSHNKIYVVKKGSIAIDGISLTIAEIYNDRIRIYIVPYTLEHTNLKYKKDKDPVNVEFDILGKYVENLSLYNKGTPTRLTEEFLKNKGFV